MTACSDSVVEDDDSGAGAGALSDALSLAAGDYVIEASTAAPRQTGSFTLTVAVAGAPPLSGVNISGFADADATPAPGGATATVTDDIELCPTDAVCSAGPSRATVSPERDAATRTVSMDVPAGTSVTVTVECSQGADTAAARALFTADAAPPLPVDVEISGLDDVTETSQPNASSVEIADVFSVAPADAGCIAYATRGTARITPAAGASRIVTLEVAAGTSEYVVVRCTNDGGDRRTAAAQFTANAAPTDPAPGCPAEGGNIRSTRSEPLSPDEPGQDPHTGSITQDTRCTSSLRSSSSSTCYARRHTFALDAPGWVTVDLHSDPAQSPRLDTYLVLSGDSLDRPIRNDDARDTSHGRYYYDSRIGPLLLPAGDYVAEATTYGISDTGGYTLTAEVTATGLTEDHTATVGAPKTVTFRYWPPDAQIAVSTAAAEEFGLARHDCNRAHRIWHRHDHLRTAPRPQPPRHHRAHPKQQPHPAAQPDQPQRQLPHRGVAEREQRGAVHRRHRVSIVSERSRVPGDSGHPQRCPRIRRCCGGAQADLRAHGQSARRMAAVDRLSRDRLGHRGLSGAVADDRRALGHLRACN